MSTCVHCAETNNKISTYSRIFNLSNLQREWFFKKNSLCAHSIYADENFKSTKIAGLLGGTKGASNKEENNQWTTNKIIPVKRRQRSKEIANECKGRYWFENGAADTNLS